MSKTIIEVNKNNNENNASLLRRFSRRVIESGIVSQVKNKRYNKRKTSKLSGKVMKLKKLTRATEIKKLKKLGKMPEKSK